MSPFEIIDPRFKALIDPVAFLEVLHTGHRWAEGPVYFADLRCLVWSDIPNNRMLRWDEESGHVACSASPPATPTATPATGRAASSPASTAPARRAHRVRRHDHA